MKFVWESKDVVGGVQVRDPDSPEVWMICYKVAPEGQTYSLVSLRDGLVLSAYPSQKSLATFLNEQGYAPDAFLPKVKHG